MAKNPLISIGRLLNLDFGGMKQIKVGKGALSTIAGVGLYGSLGLVAVAGGVAFKAPMVALAIAGMIFVLLLITLVFGFLLLFKNPDVALMPSTEYAEMRMQDVAAKGMLTIPDQRPVSDPMLIAPMAVAKVPKVRRNV